MRLAKRFGLTLLTLAIAMPAFARHRDDSSSISSVPNAQLDQLTAQFNQQAIAEFATLQQLMAQHQYGTALLQSKTLLDDARARVGLDPKTRSQDIFALPSGSLGQEYSVLGKSLADFSPRAQTTIMSTLRDLRGGVYLDLLNLLKRTELIYIECFQLQMQAQGTLLQMDIAKIKQDIADTVAIPLLVQDPATAQPLLVFDTEVSNDDQVYLFNRELEMYLMRNGRTLGYNTASVEQAVQTQIQNVMSAKKAQFIRSLGGAAVTQAPRPVSGAHLTSDGRYGTFHGECYDADPNGRVYGSSVYDSYCSVGYIVSNGSCYNRDSAGAAYGSSVYDSYCQAK